MGERIDFIQSLHASTKRNYIERVVAHDKAECAQVASRYGAEYWDGSREFGYGGYTYDGRWGAPAKKMVEQYQIAPGDRILDVGSGKGYLLYEFTQLVPGLEIAGIDISTYAIDHAKDEVKAFLQPGTAASLPYADDTFDFVVSLGTLHNLGARDLWNALAEIERVGRGNSYVMVESFRNEREKANLLYWQLTCKSFYSVDDWEWIFEQTGYRGDYGFIFFT